MIVAIIGTACRSGDYVSKDRYFGTLEQLDQHITMVLSYQQKQWDDVTLVSGGAAWSDHLAVLLFLRHPKCHLELYLPEPLINIVNGNGTTTKYHRMFEQQCQIGSLAQLGSVSQHPNVTIIVKNGFHERNRCIADRASCENGNTFACIIDKVTSGTQYTLDRVRKPGSKYLVYY